MTYDQFPTNQISRPRTEGPMNFQCLVLVDFPHSSPHTGFEHWRQLRALIGGFLLEYNYHSLLNESIQQRDAIISLFLIPPQLALVCWICFNWEGRGEDEPLSSEPLYVHHRRKEYSQLNLKFSSDSENLELEIHNVKTC